MVCNRIEQIAVGHDGWHPPFCMRLSSAGIRVTRSGPLPVGGVEHAAAGVKSSAAAVRPEIPITPP